MSSTSHRHLVGKVSPDARAEIHPHVVFQLLYFPIVPVTWHLLPLVLFVAAYGTNL